MSDIKANGQWLFKKGSDELPFLYAIRRRIVKKTSFMHLTGVASSLRADDFYNHALTEHGLRPGENGNWRMIER